MVKKVDFTFAIQGVPSWFAPSRIPQGGPPIRLTEKSVFIFISIPASWRYLKEREK